MFQLASVVSSLITVPLWEEPNSIFSVFSCQAVVDSNEVPSEPSLFQTKQTQFSPSLFECHVPLTVLLCWTHSRMSIPFLYWEAAKWTHHPRYCLISDRQRGRITSTGLCWLTDTDTAPHSTYPPGTSPPHLSFSRESCFPHVRLFQPRCRTSQLLLSNFVSSFLFPRPFWIATLPLSMLLLFWFDVVCQVRSFTVINTSLLQ